MGFFIADLTSLTEDVESILDVGPLRGLAGPDLKRFHDVMNTILATELVCVLRYRHHFYLATGAGADAAKKEFMQHAQQEQGHADLIAARLIELNGTPDFNPDTLTTRAHGDYDDGESCKTLKSMIEFDLKAELIAIDNYQAIIDWCETADPKTAKMIDGIRDMEKEHRDDLRKLLGLKV